MRRSLDDLGFTRSPARPESPRNLLVEVADGERLGLGWVFISGRFVLGLGRGLAPLTAALGLAPVTTAQLEHVATLIPSAWIRPRQLARRSSAQQPCRVNSTSAPTAILHGAAPAGPAPIVEAWNA